jgi:hypothetical protein
MSDKLTPRIGDRVTFQFAGRTHVGDLVHPATSSTMTTGYDPWTVLVDGSDQEWRISPEGLTVVDREPVAWPEGWDVAFLEPTPAVRLDMCVFMTRERFHRIRGPEGDYVAEHWDELLGGDS